MRALVAILLIGKLLTGKLVTAYEFRLLWVWALHSCTHKYIYCEIVFHFYITYSYLIKSQRIKLWGNEEFN